MHAHRSAFCLHESVRHALPETDEASQVPYKGRLYVHGVSDCARLLHPQAICAGRMLPSRQRTRSAPRNSTRFAARYPARGLPCERFTAALASRNLVHHSGPGRLARPYPVEDLHLLSFASFPGALADGSFATEVAQLKCPHLPAADIEGSARYNGPRGPIICSKAETSRTNRELKLRGRLRPPFVARILSNYSARPNLLHWFSGMWSTN